ncbi:MAG TPA: acyltransferase domain-containing protein, partial [Herpetosiphonaceae bacterium]
WGIKPSALIGHSIGEYVAATLADVFSLEDALKLVVLRGKLIQSLPTGAMLSVPRPVEEIQPLLNPALSIAAINAPALTVVSGSTVAIEDLEQTLSTRGITARRLHTSHAFHSAMMEPILAAFTDELRRVQLSAPTIPLISNVTGTWITSDEATDPRYWARHLRQPVRFADGVRELLAQDRVLLEVGPGHTLSSIARQIPDQSAAVMLSSLPHARDDTDDRAFVLGTLGKLWLAGASVDWTSFYAEEERRRVQLPTYPFERQRFWVDAQTPALQANPPLSEEGRVEDTPPPALHGRPALLNDYVAPRNEFEQSIGAIWQEVLGIEQIGVYDNFFELGGHSLLATQLVSRLREAIPIDLPLSRLLEAMTIAEQSEVIEELLIEKLEELPEAEAQRLMATMFRQQM